MARKRHPDKEIEEAVAYAEGLGWRVIPISGHAWGRLYCAHADRDGCMISVWSTPRSAGNHARDIIRAVSRCPHQEEASDEDV
jgi:hypothetical protein